MYTSGPKIPCCCKWHALMWYNVLQSDYQHKWKWYISHLLHILDKQSHFTFLFAPFKSILMYSYNLFHVVSSRGSNISDQKIVLTLKLFISVLLGYVHVLLKRSGYRTVQKFLIFMRCESFIIVYLNFFILKGNYWCIFHFCSSSLSKLW